MVERLSHQAARLAAKLVGGENKRGLVGVLQLRRVILANAISLHLLKAYDVGLQGTNLRDLMPQAVAAVQLCRKGRRSWRTREHVERENGKSCVQSHGLSSTDAKRMPVRVRTRMKCRRR